MAKGLTIKAIESARPGPARLEVRDAHTRGLYLVVQPSGHRSFAFRYRSPLTGKPAKLTIGAFPEMTLAGARTAALAGC